MDNRLAICAYGAFLMLSSLSSGQTVAFAGSPSALGANDSVIWPLTGRLPNTSTGGLGIGLSAVPGQGGLVGPVYAKCPGYPNVYPCPNDGGFLDSSNFLVISFNSPVYGIGAAVAPYFYSAAAGESVPYTLYIQAFNGATLLGIVSQSGTFVRPLSANGPIAQSLSNYSFIGVTSTTALITSIILSASGPPGMFGPALATGDLVIHDSVCSPCITSPSDGASPRSQFVAIAGTGTIGNTLDVLVSGISVGKVKVDSEGNWEALPYVSVYGSSVTIQVQDQTSSDTSNTITVRPSLMAFLPAPLARLIHLRLFCRFERPIYS
jgi:hypothetical protein